MKKIYSLLVAILVTSFSFGQNLAVNGDFESWTVGVLDTWTSESGTTITEETTIVDEGSSSARFDVTTQDQGITDFRQTIAVESGKIYDVSVRVYQGDNEARARLYVDGYRNYSDPATVGSWQTVNYEYTATATGNIEIGLRFYDTGDWIDGSTIYIDDYQVVEQVAPSLAITSPAEGSTGTSTDVTISFTVNNFTVATAGMGDGHIHYTVDGGGDVMKFDTTDINLTGLSVGPHTVVMRLVDDSHTDIVPAVTATVNFTIVGTTPVANIAALRAGTLNNYYELTGEALLTYQQSFRGQKFIEDATGAILIDDDNGIITTSYNRADGITGIKGQLTEFSGMMQFVPTEDPGAASSTGNTLTPQIVTLATLIANSEDYESELVTIQGTTMDNTTPTFNTGTVYQLTQGVDNYDFRTTFFSADYMGAEVPTTTFDLTGIITERAGNAYYVTARDINDFSVVLSIANNTIDGFKVYPNPSTTGFVNIITSSNLPKTVEIFDLLGKKVVSEKEVTSQVNISHLQTGIYVVKVTENNKSATKRLVVR